MNLRERAKAYREQQAAAANAPAVEVPAQAIEKPAPVPPPVQSPPPQHPKADHPPKKKKDKGKQKQQKPPQGPPKQTGTEKLTASCGHDSHMPIYDRDPDRERRKADYIGMPCNRCRRIARAQRKKERRREKLSAEFATNPEAVQCGWKPFAIRSRLPHGSKYECWWDETKQRWFGNLRIGHAVVAFDATCPVAPAYKDQQWFPEGGDLTNPPGPVLTDDGGGVFKLLMKLDGKWRDWLRDNTPPPVAAGTKPAEPAAEAVPVDAPPVEIVPEQNETETEAVSP